MIDTSDVIVIGGGLHGLSCALHLALAGLHVTVIEKNTVGRHASSANAGGVRQLGRALPEVPLARAALAHWHNIYDLVGDDCGFVSVGQIKVAETESKLEELKKRHKTLLRMGFEHEEIIDADTLYEQLPALAPNCVGGMIVRNDGHANPFRTVQAFRQKALSLGVKIFENSCVLGLQHLAGVWHVSSSRGNLQAPIMVNAAGAWGGQIATMLGDQEVPIKTKALMLMITERLAPFVKPVVGAQGRSLSFKQFENGTVLIGGAYEGRAELDTGKTYLDFNCLAQNAAAAAALFPAMRQVNILRCWAGIEGHMPDNMPVIGAGSQQGVYHMFGFSAHGFALAPIVGKIITDLIIDGSSGYSINDFSINRFELSDR